MHIFIYIYLYMHIYVCVYVYMHITHTHTHINTQYAHTYKYCKYIHIKTGTTNTHTYIDIFEAQQELFYIFNALERLWKSMRLGFNKKIKNHIKILCNFKSICTIILMMYFPFLLHIT